MDLYNNRQTFTQIHFSENLQIQTTCERHQTGLVDWNQQCLQRPASAAASTEPDCLATRAHRHAWHTAPQALANY